MSETANICVNITAPPANAEPVGRDITEALHNMFATPKSVIQFDGLSDLASQQDPDGNGVAMLGNAGRRLFGTPVRVELPPAWRRLKARGILRQLDPAAKLRSPAARESRIADLIEQRAGTLPLPAGCVLIATHDSHPMLWGDALTTLAVLAKCTDTVWLRSRAPSLAAALERWSVSLLVPPAFAADLPATPTKRPGARRKRRQS